METRFPPKNRKRFGLLAGILIVTATGLMIPFIATMPPSAEPDELMEVLTNAQQTDLETNTLYFTKDGYYLLKGKFDTSVSRADLIAIPDLEADLIEQIGTEESILRMCIHSDSKFGMLQNFLTTMDGHPHVKYKMGELSEEEQALFE